MNGQAGVRTATEGYDHDGNAHVESRNAKMKQTNNEGMPAGCYRWQETV